MCLADLTTDQHADACTYRAALLHHVVNPYPVHQIVGNVGLIAYDGRPCSIGNSSA